MSDNDLIRRGDALAVFEGPDDCPVQFEYGEGRYRINTLPAVTAPQGVICTWPSCGHTAKGQCQTVITALATAQPTPSEWNAAIEAAAAVYAAHPAIEMGRWAAVSWQWRHQVHKAILALREKS